MKDRSSAIQTRGSFWLVVAMSAVSVGHAQNAETLPVAADAGWPRLFTDGTVKLMIYQPQIDSWNNFAKATAHCALALTPVKGGQQIWGTLSMETKTLVNQKLRTVAFMDFRVIGVHYPSAKTESDTRIWEALTVKLMPSYPISVSLDRMLAYVDRSSVKIRETAVVLEPPPILVSTQPAALVIIDGKPIGLAVEGTDLQKIVNTNWDLFQDKQDGRYYLRDGKVWLSAKELNDAWMPVAKLPQDFSKLPATDDYKEIQTTAANPQKPTIPTLILVVNRPSELIVLKGEPVFEPVKDTQLMWVTNSEADLFFDLPTKQFFFLTSGRWFRSSTLKSNEWAAATTSLPSDFRKIPTNHPRAHVLAAVPGTREADEAVIAAAIPQTATIDRKSAKAEVKYVGEPAFEPIPETGVSFATNSPNDVFLVQDRYYLCLQGVWFASPTAVGPWEVADAIPEAIYSIPPSSPKYNVTYVSVYESTPETITYGYTAGYTGMYIGYGVPMWGTGYYYPPYYAYGVYPYPVYWPSPYYTYGASAWYNPATGIYGRGSAVYGPYGGYARGAAYNPATGSYAWGRSAWGPYGAAASGGFYNPATGGWGGTYHASNGYQSWGRSLVGRGDQWATTGSYSNDRGTVAGLQTSAGGKAVAARGSQGQGFVARSATGDIYAGRDGNVYKRDQGSGEWYRNNGSAWESVDRPNSGERPNSRAGKFQSEAQRLGVQSSGPAVNGDSVQNGLNRDASARREGNSHVQRSEQVRSNSGWTSGGWTGQRSSGWAARSPSFGRRR